MLAFKVYFGILMQENLTVHVHVCITKNFSNPVTQLLPSCQLPLYNIMGVMYITPAQHSISYPKHLTLSG